MGCQKGITKTRPQTRVKLRKMSDDASTTGTAPAQGTENSSVANSRPKRERKTVDTLKYAVKEVIEIPLDVPEGKGTPLGDIENVRQRLDKTKANSPSNILKKLHAVLFGKQKCTVKNVKAHIREFKGSRISSLVPCACDSFLIFLRVVLRYPGRSARKL